MIILTKNKKFINYLLLLLLGFAMLDIAIIEGVSDLRFFGIIIPYLTFSLLLKKKSTLTIIYVLFLTLLMSFRYFLKGPDFITEEIAVWFVLFFASGIILKWREI